VLFPVAVYTGFDEAGGYKVPIAASGATGITWKSSDSSIAGVSGNDEVATVTGLKAGTVTITASAGGKSSTATVTVEAFTSGDRSAGQAEYSSKNCGSSGCHDASGPDVTPSGIGKHSQDEVMAAIKLGQNPEGGDLAIGAANHSIASDTKIMAYLRSLQPDGIPQNDE